MKGILGKKIGMTQVFDSNDELIPVTVVEVNPNVITQVKTMETDGYNAIQIGYEDKKEKHSNKPEIGHVSKASTAPKRFVKEIRNVDTSAYELGQVLSADMFEAGDVVDVSGVSKGKGFAGVIKRHNQATGPMAHGSRYHRRPGSMGTLKPKRVIPGKKLPGHMGVRGVTIQNLEVVSVDVENNVILIKGSIPGPKKSFVVIKSAIKGRKNYEARNLINYNKKDIVEATEDTTVESAE